MRIIADAVAVVIVVLRSKVLYTQMLVRLVLSVALLMFEEGFV